MIVIEALAFCFVDAPATKVEFQWADYNVGGPFEPFEPPSDIVTLDIPAGPGVTIARASFSPPRTGHLCIRPRIDHVEDISLGNNEGQENLHIGDSHSPSEVCFSVWNQTEEPAPVHFEVRQLIAPGAEKEEQLWRTAIKHPDPQILQPGRRAHACVIVNPDEKIPPGTEARFAVTGFIGTKMIGGVNLLMTKQVD